MSDQADILSRLQTAAADAQRCQAKVTRLVKALSDVPPDAPPEAPSEAPEIAEGDQQSAEPDPSRPDIEVGEGGDVVTIGSDSLATLASASPRQKPGRHLTVYLPGDYIDPGDGLGGLLPVNLTVAAHPDATHRPHVRQINLYRPSQRIDNFELRGLRQGGAADNPLRGAANRLIVPGRNFRAVNCLAEYCTSQFVLQTDDQHDPFTGFESFDCISRHGVTDFSGGGMERGQGLGYFYRVHGMRIVRNVGFDHQYDREGETDGRDAAPRDYQDQYSHWLYPSRCRDLIIQDCLGARIAGSFIKGDDNAEVTNCLSMWTRANDYTPSGSFIRCAKLYCEDFGPSDYRGMGFSAKRSSREGVNGPVLFERCLAAFQRSNGNWPAFTSDGGDDVEVRGGMVYDWASPMSDGKIKHFDCKTLDKLPDPAGYGPEGMEAAIEAAATRGLNEPAAGAASMLDYLGVL